MSSPVSPTLSKKVPDNVSKIAWSLRIKPRKGFDQNNKGGHVTGFPGIRMHVLSSVDVTPDSSPILTKEEINKTKRRSWYGSQRKKALSSDIVSPAFPGVRLHLLDNDDPQKQGFFGSPIRHVIPSFVQHSIDWLERNALQTEGLFRITASTPIVEEFLSKIQSKEVFLVEDFDPFKENPHVVATILKRYFRELPVPLLLYENYEILIGAQESNRNVIAKLKEIVRHLPMGTKTTLRYLLQFLHKYQNFSQVNKMTAENLAMVFSPCLLRSPYELKDTFVMLRHSSLSTDLVATMILNYEDIFETDEYYEPNMNISLSQLDEFRNEETSQSARARTRASTITN